MANPTETEIQDQFGKAIQVLDELEKYANSASPNFIGMQDGLTAVLEGDYSSDVLDAIESLRDIIDSFLTSDSSVMNPHLSNYAKLIESVNTDSTGILEDIYKHFIDNTLTVQSRIFSFGSPSADGGNTGDAVIKRLNKDKNNHDIENQFSDSKRAECTLDAQTGANKFEESFQIVTQNRGKDSLDENSSGLDITFTANSAILSLLGNSSFSNYLGTLSVPTLISDWTPTTNISNFELDNVNFYRTLPNDTNPVSVKFKVNDRLTQKASVRNINFDPSKPYYLQLVYNRQVGSCDGTLTLALGSQTVNVTLAAQTGWQVLQIPLDTNSWVDNFNLDDLEIYIDLASRTTGTLLIDDVVLVSMFDYDNSWYTIISGATPSLREDFFTWTDTETGAILQKWFWRSYGAYLPHKSATPTWAEPT